MRLVTTTATGIFGTLFFGSWEVLRLFQPVEAPANDQPALRTEIVLAERSATVSERSAGGGSQESSSKPSTLDEAHQSLQKKVELLQRGRDFIGTKKDYTATLTKREFVKGELLDQQTMQMKVRNKPFSVYLIWKEGDAGREAIYVEGQNDGKIVAHDGGWKARIPAFNLSPDCALAMRDARYPITSAGLMYLIDTMLNVHESDLKVLSVGSCEILSEAEFDGRPAIAITTAYKSKDVSKAYRKSITIFDKETSLPVSTEHFEWSRQPGAKDGDLDEATLVERYSFRDLAFDQGLTDDDFDRSNQAYHFR